MVNLYSEKTDIQSFYSDKVIFVTGGTGFVGSTLIEKLLRTCPDIKKIYMLVRPKKGKVAEERVKELLNTAYWAKLKKLYPSFKDKLILVNGDLIGKNLSLSETDRNTLIHEVQIVFHVAATVRFDENLKKAAYLNIKATRDILLLCSQIKNLQSVVHVSTAYSQCIYTEIEEKFFTPPRDPDEFLEFCEKYTPEQMDEMTNSIIKDYPNTYTFTKALAENLIQKYSNKLPITIVRPSIIMGCWKEPLQGYTDNIYGPFGILAGVGNGLIRVIHLDNNLLADLVPVDMVSNCMIAAAVETSKKDYRNTEIKIYNFTSSYQNPLTWGEFSEWLMRFGKIYASIHTVWIYFLISSRNDFIYEITKYFLHTIPARLVDMVLKIRGQEPKAVKMYEKIHKNLDLLNRFTLNQWIFHDKNTQQLLQKQSIADQDLYNFDIKELEWDEYLYHSARTLRTHLLNDPLSTIPAAQRKIKKLAIVHYSFLFIFFGIIASFFYMLFRLFV